MRNNEILSRIKQIGDDSKFPVILTLTINGAAFCTINKAARDLQRATINRMLDSTVGVLEITANQEPPPLSPGWR